ncbi:hypothetical protein BT69DRAFT_1340937 [Atractiella rhizophila]|nr:hypothetical protein BT69DRAFT_1340937 [Atractiella rhizophila]
MTDSASLLLALSHPGAYVYTSAPPQNLECPICRDPMVEPTMLPCLHIFCSFCLEKLCTTAEEEGAFLKCPIDRKLFLEETVTPAPTLVRGMLDDLEVECLRDECHWTGRRGDLKQHVEGGCFVSKEGAEETEDDGVAAPERGLKGTRCKWWREGCNWSSSPSPPAIPPQSEREERSDASTSTSPPPSPKPIATDTMDELSVHLRSCIYNKLSTLLRRHRQSLSSLSMELSIERSSRLSLGKQYETSVHSLQDEIRTLREEMSLLKGCRDEDAIAIREELESFRHLAHDLRMEMELLRTQQTLLPSLANTSSASSGGSEGEEDELNVDKSVKHVGEPKVWTTHVGEPKVWTTRFPPARLPRPPPPLGYWDYGAKGREKMKL